MVFCPGNPGVYPSPRTTTGGVGVFPLPCFPDNWAFFSWVTGKFFLFFGNVLTCFSLLRNPGEMRGNRPKHKQTRRKCRKTAGDGVPGGSGLQQRGPEGHCRPHSSPGTNRMKAFACLALPRRPKSRRGGHFLPGTLHFELTGLRCDCRVARDFNRGAPRVTADLI